MNGPFAVTNPCTWMLLLRHLSHMRNGRSLPAPFLGHFWLHVADIIQKVHFSAASQVGRSLSRSFSCVTKPGQNQILVCGFIPETWPFLFSQFVPRSNSIGRYLHSGRNILCSEHWHRRVSERWQVSCICLPQPCVFGLGQISPLLLGLVDRAHLVSCNRSVQGAIQHRLFRRSLMTESLMGQYSRRGDDEWCLLQQKLSLEKIRLASSFLALQSAKSHCL